MAHERYTNIPGPLIEAIHKTKSSPVLHSDEIMCQRRANIALRNMKFWTGDYFLYELTDNNVILHVARRKHNLIYENIDEAITQLREKNCYSPKEQDVERLRGDRTTLSFFISELDLKEYKHEKGLLYLGIDTSSPHLNKSQKSLVKRVYGSEDLSKNLHMLNKNGIDLAKIFMPSRAALKSFFGGMKYVSCAGGINSFDFNSNFTSTGGDQNSKDIYIRIKNDA